MNERIAISEFAEKAYLDYSMYVVLDRALPHIGDGLKPVQRRIVYAMNELGLQNSAKHKKSARTVGDVLGKYHPHSDAACYEAMVLMAQNFSYRYPLVDGQGNWGAIDDPKSFAAMRYTEARLSPYAQLLLQEINQGTVDWVENFDGTMQEPRLLPARVPNVLLNGGSGIAVGMATDIPPHNIVEVLQACILLLNSPRATLSQVLELVPGPDLPTGGEIVSSRRELERMYATGSGQYRLRATYRCQNSEVVVDSLPYQVSGSKILIQIANQMREKKLPWVDDIRDESDADSPVRIVLTLRSSRVDADRLMSHLFATTDLERSYRVNLNIIGLDNRPQVKPLIGLLREWLEYRNRVLCARLRHRLDHVIGRLHILAGLLIAFLNLDELIAIIRGSEDPKKDLMTCFELTDRQATAILEMRLRQLGRLEQIKIEQESRALSEERKSIEAILASDARIRRLMREELTRVIEQFRDQRRTQIVERERAAALREESLKPSEPVTVVLSSKGWVRSAKADVDGWALSYRSGDGFLAQVRGRSNQKSVFLDSEGKAYTVAVSELPSARSYGEPLTGRVNISAEARIIHMLCDDVSALYLLATTDSHGFIIPYHALLSRTRNGKSVINKGKQAAIIAPARIHAGDSHVAVASSSGRLLIFRLEEVGQLNCGKGVRLMDTQWKDGELLVSVVSFNATADNLLIHAGKRFLRLKGSDFEPLIAARARRGQPLPRGFTNVSAIRVERR